jgi:hypothetical protein
VRDKEHKSNFGEEVSKREDGRLISGTQLQGLEVRRTYRSERLTLAREIRVGLFISVTTAAVFHDNAKAQFSAYARFAPLGNI